MRKIPKILVIANKICLVCSNKTENKKETVKEGNLSLLSVT